LLSDVGAQERKLLYSKGGVFFASSRILLMDFLVDRVPVHLVSGIIVMKVIKALLSSSKITWFNLV